MKGKTPASPPQPETPGKDPAMVNTHFLKLGLPVDVCSALVNPGFFDPFDAAVDITLDNPTYRHACCSCACAFACCKIPDTVQPAHHTVCLFLGLSMGMSLQLSTMPKSPEFTKCTHFQWNRLGPLHLMTGKLDWVLLRDLMPSFWYMANLTWAASDHRALIVEVT